jgi:hypothetical protein
MKVFKLIPVKPTVPAGISSSFQLVDESQTETHKVLVVSFSGVCPPGSAGNEHGHYIATTVMHGLQAFQADCVILDLRELTYTWGSALLSVFQDVAQLKDCGAGPGLMAFPVMVVTSEKCRVGVLSLLTPTGESPEWHFEDVNRAIEAAVIAAKNWLES